MLKVMVISVILALGFVTLWCYEHPVVVKAEVATTNIDTTLVVSNIVNDTIILYDGRFMNIVSDYHSLDSLKRVGAVYKTVSIDYRLYYSSTTERYYYCTGNTLKELPVCKYHHTEECEFSEYEM